MEYYEAMVGDGESTTFYFTFPFFGVNDIHVKVNDVEQTNYIMTPNPTPNDADTEYTGGTVEFLTAPANGDRITIYREIELVRHIDYQPTKKPESHQMNQDANQLMGALRELDVKLKNTLDLATIPTLADLLSEIQTISTSLDTFITADDLNDINTAVATIPDKATKDMDNITATGISTMCGYCMPDYSSAITLGASPYTAPSNGFIAINNYGTNPGFQISINNLQICNSTIANSGSAVSCFIPVSKNDIITYSGGGTTYWKYFIPLKN